MSRKILLAIAIMAFGLSAAADEAFDHVSFSERCDELFKAWEDQKGPGLAVLVQVQGLDIYRKCFGLASIEHGVPITPETSFDLASGSKQITGLAILLLEQQGKLGLEDDIRLYFPEFALRGEEIRIRHLIYHSSGLWEFWTTLTSYSGFNRRDYITMSDVLTLLQHQEELNFTPGERYEYTNTNYSILAEIVARVTGVSFGDWTKENIFEPLGMKDTHFQEDCTRIIPNKATAYLRSRDEFLLARPSNVEVPGSAHAFATLNDMGKWLDNFRTERVGGPGIFGKLTTTGVLNDGRELPYAAGLIADDHRGRTIFFHSGQTGGYKTMLVYCPGEELGLVILANERSIYAHGLAEGILDIYFGAQEETAEEGGVTEAATEDPVERREFIELEASALDRYVGGYRISGTGQKAAFFRDGDYLVAGILGMGKEYIFAVSDHEFFDSSRSLAVAFEMDRGGRTQRAVITLGEDEMAAERIDLGDAARKLVQDISGTYYSEALGAACSIVDRDGGTYLRRRRYEDLELAVVDSENLVSTWGFMSLVRGDSGVVTGFNLIEEVFGMKPVRFVKVAH
jgi:CubicO group peptidase (beta-lactamase class C family)